MAKKEEGPDQARAWAIALAACVINALLSGISRTTGLFYVALIDTYGVSRLEANLPFTLRNVIRNLGGPLAGAIGQKYGVREITIVGGIFAASGIILCTFAPDVIWICVLWGGMHGFGVALGNTLFQVVVNQYFSKYRATANGLALSGACVGSFIFPVVLEYMLAHLGLSGTFLVAGAFILHVLPAGIMMKEPPWIRRQMIIRRDLEKSAPKVPPLQKREKIVSTVQSMSVISEGKVTDEELTNMTWRKISSEVPPNTKQDSKENGELVIKASIGRDNPAFVGSSLDLNEKKPNKISSDLETQVRMRTISIGESSIVVVTPDNQQETSIQKGIIKVVKDPMFHMISLSLAAFAMLFDPTITVIIDYVKDKGLDSESAKYFISLMSLGDLLGRLCFGWVTDKNYLSIPRFMLLLHILQGGCFLLLPMFYRFDVLMALIFVYGAASGANLVMFPILVAKYLVSVQSLAIGFISVVSGIMSFGIPPLIGYFRDEIGSYNGMFYITGWLSVVVGCLWLTEPLLVRLRARLDKTHRSASVTINP
ncbi:monocarboxylate transporter 13-like [Uloborus diversus]|uniref:monocarboxylate transporter 13-like n=1 Tax=Uloborus diversus TaxID=327109 RepID=UPI00240A2557|nr:monocarboxylate transporter 13-like [Uloborus diversus]